MEPVKIRRNDKELIMAVKEIDASREWLNERLINWDERPLPDDIDEIWFAAWKTLFPRIERSDLDFPELYHSRNKEALFVATFRRYLETYG